MFDYVEMFEENVTNVWMDGPEIALELGNESRDRRFWRGEYAINNISNAVFLPQSEKTSDDPTCVREQLNRQASNVYRHDNLLCQSLPAWSMEGSLMIVAAKPTESIGLLGAGKVLQLSLNKMTCNLWRE